LELFVVEASPVDQLLSRSPRIGELHSGGIVMRVTDVCDIPFRCRVIVSRGIVKTILLLL
jgi:hypothetical protein